MSTTPDPLLKTLELDRLVRLHAWFCLNAYTWEVTFLVGTRGGSQVPELYLETLNLVLQPSEKLGGGRATPSACLPGGSIPQVDYNPKTNEIDAAFEINLDFPAARMGRYEQVDPADHTPGPTAVTTKARLRARFLSELQPREHRYQNLQCELEIQVPDEFAEAIEVPKVLQFAELIPLRWIFLTPGRELWVQPVFIAPEGATPPTGSDFYPLLARANELWAKCCIRFRAKCPIYLDEQEYRIVTEAEAAALKDEVDVSDAIEVFMVERFDPEDTWGGGVTFGSGTAAAKIVTGDNQLPLNKNHLAHELGHVLGLDHPGEPGGLVDGCAGSVMEPSGFYADNPDFQCQDNCNNASNPLLNTVHYPGCLVFQRVAAELY
jgi:hypothetical protein